MAKRRKYLQVHRNKRPRKISMTARTVVGVKSITMRNGSIIRFPKKLMEIAVSAELVTASWDSLSQAIANLSGRTQ